MTKMPIPLYQPLNTLKPIADNIWLADGQIIDMSAGPFSIPFSTRMTVVRLADGKLWCHSPLAPHEGLFEELDALGPVAHLISPNKIHYAYIAEWKKRYPDALAWASPGVEKRAASQKIATNFDCELEEQAPSAWSQDLDQLIFKGSKVMEEVVFFHRESATLILADLIENFETEKMTSPVRKAVYKVAGISDPNGKTPLDFRLTFTGNKESARKSFEKMLAWQPDKIILAHGRCYLENATAELKRAFAWLD